MKALLNFLTQLIVDMGTAEEVIESFSVIAGYKAYITVEDLKRELAPGFVDYCTARMNAYEGLEDEGSYATKRLASTEQRKQYV